MSRPEDEDVYFDVNITDYPRLAGLRAGTTPVVVTGRIASLSIGVTLDGATLIFV
jgi:hypothetical protein